LARMQGSDRQPLSSGSHHRRVRKRIKIHAWAPSPAVLWAPRACRRGRREPLIKWARSPGGAWLTPSHRPFAGEYGIGMRQERMLGRDESPPSPPQSGRRDPSLTSYPGTGSVHGRRDAPGKAPRRLLQEGFEATPRGGIHCAGFCGTSLENAALFHAWVTSVELRCHRGPSRGRVTAICAPSSMGAPGSSRAPMRRTRSRTPET
jgi:hypothetical protein